MKIIDELRQIVCASDDLDSSLAELRTKYIAALSAGCRLDRVDRTVGGPPLRTLVTGAGAGAVHQRRSSTDAATRDVAIKELCAASDGFRRLVIDTVVRQMEAELEATKDAVQPWFSEFNSLMNAMTAELESMLSWRIATGERITAPPNFVKAYDGLRDLSDRITDRSNMLRPKVARTLAVTGTPLMRIGEVVGGNTRSFGYRYRDWREFGHPVQLTDHLRYSDQQLHTIASIISGGENIGRLTRSAVGALNVDGNVPNRTFFAP